MRSSAIGQRCIQLVQQQTGGRHQSNAQIIDDLLENGYNLTLIRGTVATTQEENYHVEISEKLQEFRLLVGSELKVVHLEGILF